MIVSGKRVLAAVRHLEANSSRPVSPRAVFEHLAASASVKRGDQQAVTQRLGELEGAGALAWVVERTATGSVAGYRVAEAEGQP